MTCACGKYELPNKKRGFNVYIDRSTSEVGIYHGGRACIDPSKDDMILATRDPNDPLNKKVTGVK